MASHTTAELEQTKLRLEFYRARNQEHPNQIHTKWIQIYEDRLKKLEKQAQSEARSRERAASATAMPARRASSSRKSRH